MDCHIEIFANDEWHVAARIELSDVVRNGYRAADCVFAYDPTYVFGDVREQLALGWPVDMERHRLPVWPAFL
jgi:hypothetical protein